MALFGKKKNKNQQPQQPQQQPPQGDIFARSFDQRDEKQRRFQEELAMRQRMQQKHPDFRSEFDAVTNHRPPASDAPVYAPANVSRQSSTVPIPTENSSVAKTSKATSSHRVKLPEDCACRVGLCTAIGKRESQQDAADVSERNVTEFGAQRWMAVLCDGMGGMNGGELASTLCVEKLKAAFETIGNREIPAFYRETLVNIDDAVASLKDENGNFLGAGSTLVSVIIDGSNLYWGSVGDSHIYIIRKREMIRVNEEHNYYLELKDLARRGVITHEEAKNDKNKDALISYMGIGSLSMMEVIEKPFRLQKDDCILLCSDGLYRSVSDNEIYHVLLANGSNMQQAAEKLVECALSKNYAHQDNTTVITIRY